MPEPPEHVYIEELGRRRAGQEPGFDETEHSLLQLRIHFVSDGDHVQQHRAEVHFPQIVLQRVKDTDLWDSGFLHQHRGSVALFTSQSPVLACGNGDVGLLDSGNSQAVNQVSKKIGKVTGAVREA